MYVIKYNDTWILMFLVAFCDKCLIWILFVCFSYIEEFLWTFGILFDIQCQATENDLPAVYCDQPGRFTGNEVSLLWPT